MREYNGRRKSIGEFAGVDASVSLALSDEMGGALVGNDLEVVRTTGMEEVARGVGHLRKLTAHSICLMAGCDCPCHR